MIDKIKKFFAQCKKVVRITKKPSKMEYQTIVKVSGLGILLIGLVGFLLQMLWTTVFA